MISDKTLVCRSTSLDRQFLPFVSFASILLHTMVVNSIPQQQKIWQNFAQKLGTTPGIVLDLGGGSPHQGPIKSSDLATNTQYYCLDIRSGGKPHVIGDVMRLPFASDSVEGILSNAVLEHIPNPQEAVDEMYRVLRPGYRSLVAVPFVYPYHDQVDYYRFSDDALRYLFRNFSSVDLYPLGNYAYLLLMFFSGFQFRIVSHLNWLAFILEKCLNIITRLPGIGHNYSRSIYRTVIGWYVVTVK